MINLKHFLEIAHLGPIKKAKIDLSKHTLIIGPQASGKSVIAKLIYIFGKESNIVCGDNYLLNEIAKYGLSSFFSNETRLKYESENIVVDYKEGQFDIIRKQDNASILFQSVFSECLYIPVERYFMPIISDSIFSLLNKDIDLPSSIIDFAAQYERSRKSLKLVHVNYLGATYQYEDNREKIITKQQVTKFAEAASGFQSIFPLIITYKHFIDNNAKKVIIEEPELNLFPDTQKRLSYHLFSIITQHNRNERLFVTTHSPFIMAAFNNLLLAGMLYEKYQDIDQVDEIIGEKAYIPINSFNAYHIINGNLKSIFNKETGMIAENIIDDVSGDVRDEFNTLMSAYFD